MKPKRMLAACAALCAMVALPASAQDYRHGRRGSDYRPAEITVRTHRGEFTVDRGDRRWRRTAPGHREEPHGSGDQEGIRSRELEILTLVAKGFSVSEVAELLSIADRTVTTHVQHIYRKLEVTSRSQAIYEAVNLGLIDLKG